MTAPRFILTLSCTDRPGIVAAVGTFLADHCCNIIESAQFGDVDTGRFFMRVVFDPGAGARGDSAGEALTAAFAQLANEFGMVWTLRDRKERRRVMILSSQTDHCLADLIWRWRQGELGGGRRISYCASSRWCCAAGCSA